MRGLFLSVYRLLYEHLARPLFFRRSPQDAHAQVLRWLAWLDDHPAAQVLLRLVHSMAFGERSLEVGGVRLTHPLIVAAGFVKGDGFTDEAEALRGAAQRNIIPGWRSLPLLVGAVEFGSFTLSPRLGNPGTVLWRDELTHSTQNRIGLKNPGARAAAAFLAQRRDSLPPVFGINVAVSPGVTDAEQECQEVLEVLAAFIEHDVRPSWFTLNLSCPNTEDDPGSHQTEARARSLCAAVTSFLQPYGVPLWVKVSPALAGEQYQALLRAFAETGVRAVIATNTLAAPAPDGTTAGVGGGSLHRHALEAAALLHAEIVRRDYPLDVIACGGVEDRQTYQAFARLGVKAAQYWSSLIYGGPLAAALIEQESRE